jgi:RHS repeat-associated protein
VIVRKYTWGLDLSGTFQDAGGIGGLLALHDPEDDPTPDKNYMFFYGANGNVGQLIDWENDGALVATYEYTPYGSVYAQAGDYAEENPIHFSTKYFDTETALGYWGYRYYSPRLGRWLNRDPIKERGGKNLYRFVLNSPLGWIDPDGLIPQDSQPASQKAPPERQQLEYRGKTYYFWDWTEPKNSIWQRMAEGRLVHCPATLTLPPAVEEALGSAMKQTAEAGYKKEAGGVLRRKGTYHTVWGPVRGHAEGVASKTSAPGGASDRDEHEYGSYHTHPGQRDSVFSKSDLRWMERVNRWIAGGDGNVPRISLMRNCQCTRAAVVLGEGLKNPEEFAGSPTLIIRLRRDPETGEWVTPRDEAIAKWDETFGALAEKHGFCYYKSCEGGSQQTLKLIGGPGE